MDETLSLATRLGAALNAGDGPALSALLAPDATFQRLGARLDGRDALVTALSVDPLYRRIGWRAPAPADGAIRLVGDARDPVADPGLVLTLSVAGDAVVRIEQQRTPPRPPPARPMVLPAALRTRVDRALVDRRPMLMAYADPEGQPVLSYRGSVRSLDDDRLSLWVRNPEGRLIESIRVNPKVALMYRDEDSRATYQFLGRAHVTDDPELRDRVYRDAPEAERHHDFARLGMAVVIDLDRVEGYAGVGPGGQIARMLLLRHP